MFLHVLVKDIKDNLKLINNSHIFEPNILRSQLEFLITFHAGTATKCTLVKLREL